MNDLLTTIFGLIAWALEYVWIAFIIFFIWWMMKVYFNEKEIKEKEVRINKVEAEKRIAHIETKLMEAEGRIKELEHENKLLRIRISELEN